MVLILETTVKVMFAKWRGKNGRHSETYKMGKSAELCQIAAINQAGDQSFAEYILSNKNIGRHASKVNNLTIRTINGQRALYREIKASTLFLSNKLRNQHKRMFFFCSPRS